jgi:septal ring factor EnvC (AmiA/AmiB activator)
VCKNAIGKAIKMDRNMDEKYRAFFLPLDNTIKNVEYHVKIFNFQRQQYQEYLKHLWSVEDKLKKLEEVKKKLLVDNKEMAKRLEKMRAYRRSLQQELRERHENSLESSGYVSSPTSKMRKSKMQDNREPVSLLPI